MTDTNFWKNRWVLVTGGTGFLGGNILRRLRAYGANVIALVPEFDRHIASTWDAERLHVHYGRVENFEDVRACLYARPVETVIHLAAQAIVGKAQQSPLAALETNIRGTYNVLEAVRCSGSVKETIVASSDKAYGAHKILPYAEETPLLGSAPYDCSKACVDALSRCYASTYDLPIAVTRCVNMYGPGDMNFDRLVPGTIKSLLCNEPLILRSDGQFVRDYLYVEDGVDAYLTLAEQTARPGTRGNAWNFGAGNPTRVIDIIAMLGRICSKNPSPIITNSAKAEIHDQYLDSTRARQILGWVPRWSLESGLLATVAWYKAYFEKTVPSFAQIPQL